MKKARFIPSAAVLVASLAMGFTLSGCGGSSGDLPPKGVPAAVKTVKGDVANVVKSSDKNTSFSVTVKSADEQQAALKKLTDNGFEVKDEHEGDEYHNYSLFNEKAKVEVALKMETKDDKFIVSYNVMQH